MRLAEVKREFNEGKISKWEYVDKMYDIHEGLFDYAEFIQGTNISAIEISDRKVIMTFRDSGVRFICSRDDKRLAPFDTINFEGYEKDELQMQLRLIQPGDTILDIGGNFGWYAIHIAKKFPDSKIYSFEPIPGTFNHLNENILLNDISNIIALNFGLSDKSGSFTFYYDHSLSVNASLANVSGNENVETVVCRVEKLDDFIEKKNIKIDFIKCDVEGAELLAFKGGMKSINKYKPIVFTEMLRKWTAKFDYHPNEIIRLFEESGYQCFTIKNGTLKPFGIVEDSTIETNYIFLHKVNHKVQIEEFQMSRTE